MHVYHFIEKLIALTILAKQQLWCKFDNENNNHILYVYISSQAC